MSKLQIKRVDEHFEAYVNGKFLLSGDTFEEVIKELEEQS